MTLTRALWGKRLRLKQPVLCSSEYTPSKPEGGEQGGLSRRAAAGSPAAGSPAEAPRLGTCVSAATALSHCSEVRLQRGSHSLTSRRRNTWQEILPRSWKKRTSGVSDFKILLFVFQGRYILLLTTEQIFSEEGRKANKHLKHDSPSTWQWPPPSFCRCPGCEVPACAAGPLKTRQQGLQVAGDVPVCATELERGLLRELLSEHWHEHGRVHVPGDCHTSRTPLKATTAEKVRDQWCQSQAQRSLPQPEWSLTRREGEHPLQFV